MKENIKGRVPLGAIQGPPGTGKTSVIELFAEENLPDIITGNDRILIMYIGPTNYLVLDAYWRIVTILLRKGIDLKTILKSLRVFGSRIKASKTNNPLILPDNTIIDVDALKLATGDINTEDVRLIFTTEFQRLSRRLKGSYERIHIIVDEGSKSPYFRIFLPLAEKLVANPESYPESLLVLGDPQQAIAIPEEFKEFNIPLLMTYVRELLRRYNVEKRYWKMLDVTFRLPKPSHEPISYGYYDGKLSALYSSRNRLNAIKDVVLDNRNKILQDLRNVGVNIYDPATQAIVNAIDNALSSDIPLVLIETRRFGSGDTFEPQRTKYAFIASSYLQAASNKTEHPFDVAVTAPYSDLVGSIAFRFDRMRLSKRVGKPRITTVQSVIGGESDVIVTMLGKEWIIKRMIPKPFSAIFASDLYETLYIREPEMLNVQLSRHKSLLVVIGNISNLKRLSIGRDNRIAKTGEKLLNLAEEEKAIYVNLSR